MRPKRPRQKNDEACPEGLAAPAPEFWQRSVTLELNLLTVMAMHGNLCLALRHPQNNGNSRPIVTAAIRALGEVLVESGALTAERVAEAERAEGVAIEARQ